MSKTIAVLDLDWCKYTASAAGEKRTIRVVNKKTGDEFDFKNRTEFWGNKKSVIEGWLGEQNRKHDTDWSKEDFTITDIQTPDNIENVLHTAKCMVEAGLANLGTKTYKAFLGEGESFRVERSTLLKYKSNRAGVIKPLYLDDVTEYLRKRYKPEIVTNIENDDRVVMEAYKKPDHVVTGVDKDFYGCPVRFFNVDRVSEGVVNGDCFGKLWRNDKGDVRGFGRMFMYYQTCSNDTSDNYAANCFSEKKWASVSAYNALHHATNDKEAWEAIICVFKLLYPESKEVVGWRGEVITIDWKYVLNECFDMARMHRFENDFVIATDVINKLGIER